MKPVSAVINGTTLTRTATCKTHGEYDSRSWLAGIWTGCPKCAEIEAAKAREAQAAREAQDRLDAWQRRIGQAGIPPRFQDRSLDAFVAATPAQEKALAISRIYAETFKTDAMATGRSMIFIGHPGTGKTHLAAGIGLHVMREFGRTVLFCTVVRAIRRVKDTWARGSVESETEAVNALAMPDLLILDEVGVQFGSEAEKLILFDIINERYERRRPTLLLSNLSVDGVRSYLGDRIFDRLREDCGRFVIFDWESYRGKK